MSGPLDLDWDDTEWAQRLPNWEASIGPDLQRHGDFRRKVASLTEQLELAELDAKQCEDRMELIIRQRYSDAELDGAT